MNNSTRNSFIIGDIITLFVFVLLGKAEHGLVLFNTETWISSIPLIAAWLLIGKITSLYKDLNRLSFKTMLRKIFLTTILAIPIGLIIRALLLGHAIPLSFLLVAFSFTFVLMVVWRSCYLARIFRINK